MPKKDKEKPVKKKSNYADDNYRRRSTIILGIILLAFAIAVALFLVNAWQNGVHITEVFEENRKAALATPEKERLDTSSIEIEVSDNDFYYWTQELDNSYQLDENDENYAAYDGCTIHIQGYIEKKGAEGHEYYWVCRKMVNDTAPVTTQAAHGSNVTTTVATTENKSTTAEVSYTVLAITVLTDEEMPKDGTWVDVVGTVTVDTIGFAGIKDAKVTVMEKDGKLVID